MTATGRILLMAGMPGAGKTTVARRLAEERDAVRLTCDDLLAAAGLDPHDARLRRRLERELWRHALDLAGRGLVVVVDFGSWTRPERRWHREQARAAGVAIELHSLDVPLQERWRRLELRNVGAAGRPAGLVITRAQLEDYERWWQPPDAEERAGFDPPTTS